MSPALAGGFFTSEPPRCGSLVWSNVCGTATGEADTAEQSLGEFMAIPVFFPISCSPVVLKVIKQFLIKWTLSMLISHSVPSTRLLKLLNSYLLLLRMKKIVDFIYCFFISR